eukprot:757424-Hanusia_phi.AAC.3
MERNLEHQGARLLPGPKSPSHATCGSSPAADRIIGLVSRIPRRSLRRTAGRPGAGGCPAPARALTEGGTRVSRSDRRGPPGGVTGPGR